MNLAPLLAASPAIIVHTALATGALLLGATQLVLPKGTLRHKLVGYGFVIAVALLALASFFIHTLAPSLGPFALFGFSPLHLLSITTLYGLIMAMWHIKKGRVKDHAATMRWLYFSGLVIAGAFTLLPGRLLFTVFFGG